MVVAGSVSKHCPKYPDRKEAYFETSYLLCNLNMAMYFVDFKIFHSIMLKKAVIYVNVCFH